MRIPVPDVLFTGQQMWRDAEPTRRDLDEIAKRLRLLGCTEEQVHRHLAPLLKGQSVSLSPVNHRPRWRGWDCRMELRVNVTNESRQRHQPFHAKGRYARTSLPRPHRGY